jgi:hypothetical protein
VIGFQELLPLHLGRMSLCSYTIILT